MSDDQHVITEQEDQLLYLLRGQDADNFELKILCSDGRWTVELSTLEPPGKGVGTGSSFNEAWDAVEPWFARRR